MPGTENMNQYLAFLQKEHQLQITIHDARRENRPFLCRLRDYTIHNNRYCMYIKSVPALWNRCIEGQGEACRRCAETGTFFGMCYAGVEEYVVPVMDKTEILAFISVGGYRLQEKKANARMGRLSREFGLDMARLETEYREALRPDVPSDEFIRSTTGILSDAVRQLYHDAGGERLVQNSSTEEYVYNHILAYIDQHLQEKILLDDLALFCHCSVSYISHMFSRKAGMGVSAYINRRRVAAAMEMLRDTPLPVGEIALLAGFEDPNYFANVFKAAAGMTATAYRKTGSYRPPR